VVFIDAEKIVKNNPPLDVMHIEEKIVRDEKKKRGSVPLDILLAAAKYTF
jgi:hypothetical protein